MSEKAKKETKSAVTEDQQKQLDMMKSLGKDVAPTIDIEFGSAVNGTVVSMTEESIFVDIALRNEAILTKNVMLDDEGNCTVIVGDKLDLFVVSLTEDEVIVSKRMKKGKAGKPLLRDLMAKGVPIEGRITGMNKGGFNVTILGHRCFCPFSSIDVQFPSEPAKYMAQTMDFVIARIENRGNNIVLSRLPLLEGNLAEKLDEIEALMEKDEPITGTVTRIANFGAFVDLGGIEGLVHISELTWDRDEKTEEVVQEGTTISVKIVGVERKESLRESRISLSLKRLEADPWESAFNELKVGEKADGVVTRLVGFGAFVKLLPGVEGLIRTEEMGWGRVRKPSEVVKKGDKINVTIISIGVDARKIDCSIKDMADNPWANIEKTFAIGSKVEGTVADEKDYGFFVDLNDEITGLLLKKRVGKDVKLADIKKGEKLEVTIDSVSIAENRIALSVGTVEAYDGGAADRNETRKYMKSQTKQSGGATEFGDMLKRALKK